MTQLSYLRYIKLYSSRRKQTPCLDNTYTTVFTAAASALESAPEKFLIQVHTHIVYTFQRIVHDALINGKSPHIMFSFQIRNYWKSPIRVSQCFNDPSLCHISNSLVSSCIFNWSSFVIFLV